MKSFIGWVPWLHVIILSIYRLYIFILLSSYLTLIPISRSYRHLQRRYPTSIYFHSSRLKFLHSTFGRFHRHLYRRITKVTYIIKCVLQRTYPRILRTQTLISTLELSKVKQWFFIELYFIHILLGFIIFNEEILSLKVIFDAKLFNW